MLRCVVASLSVLATLVALELGLRGVGWEVPERYVTTFDVAKIRDPLPDVRYLLPAHCAYSQVWPSDPRGYFDPGHRLAYRVNNFGFRGDDLTLQRTDAMRVAVLGDSFCWGLGVRDGETAVDQLRASFRRSPVGGSPVELFSFCLPGYGTVHQAGLYEAVVRHFAPDVLVVWYFLNDVNRPPEVQLRWHTGRGDLRTPLRVGDVLLLPLNRYAAKRRLREAVDRVYRADTDELRGVADSLQRIHRIASGDGPETVVLIQPWLTELEDYPFGRAHDLVAEVSEGLGFDVVDLRAAFAGLDASDLWVHELDHHLNEVGHERVARFVEPTVRALLEAQRITRDPRVQQRWGDASEGLRARPGEAWYEPFVRLATSGHESEAANAETNTTGRLAPARRSN